MRFLPLFLLACENEEVADETPPSGVLSLDTPAQGDFTEEGQVNARGAAEFVSDVLVNGNATKPNGGVFDTKIDLERGVNVVEVSAIDGNSQTLFVRNAVLAGDFKSADDAVEEAIFLRVNEGGFRRIGEIAEGALTSQFVNESLSGMNPVYSDSYGAFGWDAVTIAANIDSITFDTPSFDFEPRDGAIDLMATLPNLYVDIYAWGEAVGFDFDSDVAIGASSAVLTATLGVTAENGKLDIELSNAAIVLNGFWYNTDLLPSTVTDYLLVDTIRATIEEMLVAKIEEMVPSLLDETLSGLDPSFSTELMGLTVDIEFEFANAEIDEDGIALTLDMDVAVPPTGQKDAPGFLRSDLGTPDVDTHADVSGAVSDNLLNRVLFEVWAGGLLDLRLSTDDGTLDPLILVPLKAETGTIEIEALLPPVVVERDGNLQAQIGELVVNIDTPGGALGDHLQASVTAFVELEVQIEDGALVLAMGDPELVLMVRENAMGASNETATNIVAQVVPIDALLLLLGDFSFPLPSLYGITIDEGTATRDESGVYTGIEISLE